jgi:hypothetical protein
LHGWGRYPMRGIILVTLAALSIALFNIQVPVFALTQTSQFESQTITGNDLKNNPMAAKILAEIEYSKQQIKQLEQDQKNKEVNAQLIEQQRAIAKQLEDQAYQMLQLQSNSTNPQNAFAKFVDKIPNDNVKHVFLGEFDFMQNRVNAGNLAMKQVLANGGTWDEAMQAFSQHASIKRIEMISINTNLNIKYGLANSTIQAAFDQNGLLPDDYIKIPNHVLNHAGT